MLVLGLVLVVEMIVMFVLFWFSRFSVLFLVVCCRCMLICG